MKKAIFASLIAFGFWAFSAVAHEGHDAPTTLKAPKGGVLKELMEARVEVVSKGKDLKIYFYDKEMKPTQVSGFKVSARAELPRTKKIENLELKAQETFFESSYDAQGAHRYTLKLTVTDLKLNDTDHLTFTIEPKK